MRWLTGGQVLEPEGSSGSCAPTSASTVSGSPRIVPSASPAADDTVVDLDGCWLLPGLIDCHVHLTQPTDAGDPAAAASPLRRRGRALHRGGGRADAGRGRHHRPGRRRLELRGDGGTGGHRGRSDPRAAAVPGRPAAVDHHRHGRRTTRGCTRWPTVPTRCGGPCAASSPGAPTSSRSWPPAPCCRRRPRTPGPSSTRSTSCGPPSRWPTTTSSPSPRTPMHCAGHRATRSRPASTASSTARSPTTTRWLGIAAAGTFVVPDDLRRRAAVPRPADASTPCPRTCAGAWSSSTTSTCRHDPAGPRGRRAHRHGHRRRHARQPPRSERPRVRPHGDPSAGCRRPRASARPPRPRPRSCAASRSSAVWTQGPYADVIACAGDPFEDIDELTRVTFVMKGGHVHRRDAAS